MKHMTLCFLMRDAPQTEVLLGWKKTGFGSGKYAGIGGKVEPGETTAAAAVREVQEEIGVQVLEQHLEFMGQVTFRFPAKPAWDQEVSIFIVKRWQGEPYESSEMKPAWFSPDAVPYASMWQDARCWLPPVLDGQKIRAAISFEQDNESVARVCLTPLPSGAE